MSKTSAPRRLGDTEASATLRAVRVSPQKLNLVAQLIRGSVPFRLGPHETFSGSMRFGEVFF